MRRYAARRDVEPCVADIVLPGEIAIFVDALFLRLPRACYLASNGNGVLAAEDRRRTGSDE